MDKFDYKLNNYIKPYQDKLLRPLVYVLTKLRLSAVAITYFSLLLMLSYLFFIKKNSYWALLFLLLALFFDIVDGSLARYQGNNSDRGKFIDMFNDIIIFALFVWGLIYGGYLSGLTGMTLASTLIISKVLRIAYFSAILKSDWHFKAFAGFTPNSLVYLCYFAFFLLVLSGLNLLSEFGIIISVFLFLDIFLYYLKIISPARKNY